MAALKNSGQKIPRRGRFGVDVSAWTFRRGHFDADVPARTFWRVGFGAVVSARSDHHFGERDIVLFGKGTLSFLSSLQRKIHNFFFGKYTVSSLKKTQCPLWTGHTVLRGKDTVSSVARNNCPRWKRHIVPWAQQNFLLGNDTMSCVETMIECGKFMKGVNYRVF